MLDNGVTWVLFIAYNISTKQYMVFHLLAKILHHSTNAIFPAGQFYAE